MNPRRGSAARIPFGKASSDNTLVFLIFDDFEAVAATDAAADAAAEANARGPLTLLPVIPGTEMAPTR